MLPRPSPASQHEHTTPAETLNTTSDLSGSPTARRTKSTTHKVSKISNSAHDSFTNLYINSSPPGEATSIPGSSSVFIIPVTVLIVSVIVSVALALVVYYCCCRRQRFTRVCCCPGVTGLPDRDKVDVESELLSRGEYSEYIDYIVAYMQDTCY